jgi:DNA invertase Pin-like site-specific DNA recombinase
MVEGVGSAGVYARISDDHEGRGLGVARQVKECREEAARRGWPVGDVYVDNDRSAYRGKRRPEFVRLVEDLKAGDRDAVIVYHQDRLTRSPRELEDFVDLYEAVGLRGFASASGGTYDLASGDGRLMARVQGAFARKESDDKSRRGRSKHRQLAEAGAVSGGGTRPYGYGPDRTTVVPGEAAVLRDAAQRVLAGESLRSITADLNDRGIPTVRGGRWNPVTLRQMLVSARIAGMRSLGEEIVAQAVWPQIIDARTSARLRALLLDPARRTSRPVRRYVLAGLLRCGKCETVLVSRPRRDGTRRYVCPTGEPHGGCGGVVTLAEPVERWLTEAVLYRLDSPQMARAMHGAQRDDVAAAAADAELNDALTRQDDLAALFAASQISRREWLAARAPIQTRVARAKQRVAQCTRAPLIDEYVGHSARLRRRWDALNLDRQRAIIAAVLDHAIVGPALRGRKTFDPARITPVWKR